MYKVVWAIRDQIANIHWIIEKAREFQKNIYFYFIDYAKDFNCVDHNKLWNILSSVQFSHSVVSNSLRPHEKLHTQRIFQFVVIHTVKGFSIVNEAEEDVLLEFSCFFHDPADIGNLISGSSAFSKTSLNIWKFTYCWSLAWRILSITLLACEMSAIVW